MDDPKDHVPIEALLHDMAERLQASDNYLSAARKLAQLPERGGDMRVSLDKALGEFRRAEAAYHRLRTSLARGVR